MFTDEELELLYAALTSLYGHLINGGRVLDPDSGCFLDVGSFRTIAALKDKTKAILTRQENQCQRKV